MVWGWTLFLILSYFPLFSINFCAKNDVKLAPCDRREAVINISFSLAKGFDEHGLHARTNICV